MDESLVHYEVSKVISFTSHYIPEKIISQKNIFYQVSKHLSDGVITLTYKLK